MNTTLKFLSFAVAILVFITVTLVGALLVIRRRRSSRNACHSLPLYDDKRTSACSSRSHHRRVRVRPSQTVHIISEKEILEEISRPSTPSSGVPEIRITFPEELDSSGKRQSGRVVVVHVGENGIGLEPCSENPPAYQHLEDGRFDSVDLERVGGLVEKKHSRQHTWRDDMK